MMSGTSLPASVASSLVRWLAHCWYSTLTSAPVSALNLVFAASTTFGQPLCASTMSQTLSVLHLPSNGFYVVVELLPELHAAAPTSATARAAAAAILRFTPSSSIAYL